MVCVVLASALMGLIIYAQFLTLPPLSRQWKLMFSSKTPPLVFTNMSELICRTVGVDFVFPAPPSGAVITVVEYSSSYDTFYGTLLISWNKGDDWVAKYRKIFNFDSNFAIDATDSCTKFAVRSNPERGISAGIERNSETSIVMRVNCFGDL